MCSYVVMHAVAAVDTQSMSSEPGSRALAAAQLVQQATRGDLDAFEQLVRRFQRRVYGFAYHHLRDADEAHDLAQEIFVKLYRNLARYDADRPFEPWFWRLAANIAINYRRKRVPIPAEPVEEAGLEDAAHGHDPVLVSALAELDPAYRLPVLLHYYADLSVEQVSQTLGITVAATKSRLHRARATLRNALAEAEEADR